MHEATVQAVARSEREARVTKVFDLAEIAKYAVFSLPALAVDDMPSGLRRRTGGTSNGADQRTAPGGRS